MRRMFWITRRTADVSCGEARRANGWAFAFLYLACLVVLGPTVKFSQWTMSPDDNQSAAEAMAWLEGRLDLPSRGGDIAVYDGRFYNVFPPLWTIVCYIYYSIQLWLIGPPPIWYPIVYSLVVAAPIPGLIYAAFRSSAVSPKWAALLAFHMIAGTCLWTVSSGLHRGWHYSLQLVLAQSGIAMVAIGLLGAPRYWLAALGVLIASWSRQTCLAYAVPVVVLAWMSQHRWKALMQAAVPLVIALAVPMTLNALKFDSPLDSGYRHIFQPGEDPLNATGVYDDDGTIDVFAWRFVAPHAYSMWIDAPNVSLTHEALRIDGNAKGNAIWIGTPLLLLALIDVKRWWRDPRRRWLMLATLPIIAAHLLYHGPVIGQAGYYRYSLDFVMIWLLAVAPETTTGPRRTFALTSLLWSVFYFYTITRGFI